MLSDFTLIQSRFDDFSQLNLYPLGDVHIGSKECNLNLLKQWIDMVGSDPNGRVVLIGDMMNMGLKNSCSNIYEEALSPIEQKELTYELLSPIADKILADRNLFV